MTAGIRTLGELAALFTLDLRGDAALPIHGVATLADASQDHLGFLSNPRYRSQLESSPIGQSGF
ncbi:MAG: LpxD N-terminal domain-containing protein, partial [Dokdonella sp.]